MEPADVLTQVPQFLITSGGYVGYGASGRVHRSRRGRPDVAPFYAWPGIDIHYTAAVCFAEDLGTGSRAIHATIGRAFWIYETYLSGRDHPPDCRGRVGLIDRGEQG
jgi:hypothetical protein